MSQQAVVYVVCGTQVPEIPTNLCGSVGITVIADQIPTNHFEQLFFDDTPVQKFDKWLVEGATVGFTGDGALRLSSAKHGRCATWIRNTRKIYGVADYGPIRGNYRFCRKCGSVAGCRNNGAYAGEEFFDRERNVSLVIYHCSKCGHSWDIEKSSGRPRPPVAFRPGANKPAYVRKNHKNGKSKSKHRGMFRPQFT
jgi:hypothetical protein